MSYVVHEFKEHVARNCKKHHKTNRYNLLILILLISTSTGSEWASSWKLQNDYAAFHS